MYEKLTSLFGKQCYLPITQEYFLIKDSVLNITFDIKSNIMAKKTKFSKVKIYVCTFTCMHRTV